MHFIKSNDFSVSDEQLKRRYHLLANENWSNSKIHFLSEKWKSLNFLTMYPV